VARCHTSSTNARISSDNAAERAPGDCSSFIGDQPARATAKLFT
jgi:hypothetical protein